MQGPAPAELLTLQQAADELKVHYMTAYRWVRQGDLPAFKTGGRLRIKEADLARFVTERQVDVALPSRPGQRTDWPVHVARLHEHLLAGDAVRAGGLVRRVVADGAAAGDVHLRLLAPAMHHIGDDWAAGRITVADEHRATEITGGIMARLSESFRRRGPARGCAVTLTPAGEPHGLAAAMVADLLRAGGFEVHHLGTDVPVTDLRRFLEATPADVVCVSVTALHPDPALYADIVGACRQARPATTVVFGGQALDEQAATAAGALPVRDLDRLPSRLLTAPV